MKAICKALIFDSQKNVLILRRSSTHPNWPQGIDFPGGDVEVGESFKSGLIREILEETGLRIDERDFSLVSQINVEGRDQLVYLTRLDVSKPKLELSWEHEEYDWVIVSKITPELNLSGGDLFHKIILSALAKLE